MSSILYRPVSPPQDTRDVPRYLDDELNRIANSLEQINTRINNALPWKGYFARITGGGTSITFVADQLYNCGQPVRQSVGVYRFTLAYPVVQGIQVLSVSFPATYSVIVFTPHPADTDVWFTTFTVVNAATGVFDVSLFGGQVPISGKLTLVAYDLRLNDLLYVSGTFSLDTKADLVAYNLLAGFAGVD